MLTAIYAESHKEAQYAECRYAECRYAEWLLLKMFKLQVENVYKIVPLWRTLTLRCVSCGKSYKTFLVLSLPMEESKLERLYLLLEWYSKPNIYDLIKTRSVKNISSVNNST
jgi:hypothetical protein